MLELGSMTWPEVAAAPPILLVALGSTEQHGPHLPLDTDTRIALEVATRVAATTPGLVVAPAVAIGASGEHAGFAGTLSVGAAVFEETIVELGRSADAFAGVVWVNAHGGNSEALRRAHRRLADEGRDTLVLRCAFPGGDAHAGRTETSLLLSIAPDVVRLDRAVAGEARPWSELAADIVAGGIRAVSANGVLGDPAGATAAEGDVLLADLVDRLARVVADWARDLDRDL
jgi:mycofactocin precursor peptide peptidase